MLNNLVGGVYMALMDPYGLELMSVQMWGIALGVASTGFLIGGIVVSTVGLGSNPIRTMLLLVGVMGVIGMLFAIRDWWPLFVAGCWLYMALSPAVEAAEQTVIQKVVPYQRQGRVFGFASAMEAAAAPVMEEPISSALQIDAIRIELGYGLLGLINTEQGHRLTDQVKGLRRQLAMEMGYVLPAVRIQDNLQINANSYIVRIKEIEAGRGDLRPNMVLVMDPRGDRINMVGEETTEPTFGLPAMWVDAGAREEALFRGYTVVDPSTVITTHLTEIVKDNMSELLSHAETQKLLDDLPKENQKLIADLIPSQISVGGTQRVLQSLLSERVSIRDLPNILEGVSEACGYSRNITAITEHVRVRLARQISDSVTDQSGVIPLVTLSPDWEQAFANALHGDGDDKQLVMAPTQLQQFIQTVRQTFERFTLLGESPVLLTSPGIRPYVRSIIERFRPLTTVMSQNEIHAKAKIRTLGQV